MIVVVDYHFTLYAVSGAPLSFGDPPTKNDVLQAAFSDGRQILQVESLSYWLEF